ncbi:MAG TPA: TonB-dependent receptor [Bryobacteraceae bacterium]|nr:TonB-dependent receptor [Bryobacteraceae bacterium]
MYPCLGVLLLITSAPLLAQSNTATILGTVTDNTGAVLPGATVSAVNVATQVAKTTASGPNGEFEIPLLSVGEYAVSAELSKFKRSVRTGILLDAGQKAKLDFSLHIGDVSDHITVEAAASLLATQTPERGVVIGSGQVDNLPLNGRNFSQLISLEPGVVVGGQINGAITFNGLPYQGVTINVDGTDAANPDRPTTSNFGGQTRMNIISQDFIQEFKTTQGVFSAETGRASAGSVNVITKSGSNQFHGGVFEFVRNDRFDARTFFARTKDKLRLNQFGATLGGRILRDKLFFFGGWEGAREVRGQQLTGTVPTALLRDMMLSANPAYSPILTLMPAVTEPIANDPYRGIHRRSDVRSGRENVYMGRLDYAPGSRDNLFARYTILNAFVVQPDLSPVNGLTYPSQDQTATLSWSRTLTPQSVNEVRFGFNKQDLPRTYASFAPFATGQLSGFISTTTMKFLRANGGSFTLLDNFSHTMGRHSLKTGFEVRRFHYGRSNYQNPIYFMDTLSDLLNSSPRSINVNTLFLPVTRMQTTETGLYVQDDIRATSHLTLNLGLRWEYYTPPTESNGNLYNVVESPYGPFRKKGDPLWDRDLNNFGPRLGLAWEMFGSRKDVLRAGAGVFYSENMLRNVSNLTQPPQTPGFLLIDRADTPNLKYPFDVATLDTSKLVAPLSRLLSDPKHRTTYSEQWTLDYQRELLPDLVATVGYVGNRGLKLLQLQFLNQVGADGRRPVPTVGQIRYEANNGSSVYHALQTSLRKRFSHGFLLNAHYTYGKSLTYGGSEEGINDIQDPNNIRGSRSRTTLSLTHVLSINYGWDLPLQRLLATAHPIGRALVNGWRLNGITNIRSGFPLNMDAGKDNFGSGQNLGQRPNYVGGDIRAGTDDYRTSNLHNYINRAAFAPNGKGEYGNVGGYVLTGPGNQTFDFSLFKNTVIRERTTLQFRTELFNLFNHANFSNPSTNLNSSTFGRITGTGPAREIQFGLKILF